MTKHEENEDEGAREIRENRQTDDCETQKLEIGLLVTLYTNPSFTMDAELAAK